MTFLIRETREEDFGEVAELLEEANLKELYFTRERFRRMLERNKGLCYVAEAEKRIVGTAYGMHDGAFRSYIGKLAVAKEWRKQKIASRLIQTIMKKLEELEISLVFVHIKDDNEASLNLFKSLGFKRRESRYIMDKERAGDY